jgi:hypothetical protein
MGPNRRIIELPVDSPKTIGLYVYWVYTGKLLAGRNKPREDSTLTYMDLVDSYILGDRILDTKFQNSAIDAVIEISCTKMKDGF